MTGLTVTIGAVITLFVLMQATGRVDWSSVFRPRPAEDADRNELTPPPIQAGVEV